MHMNQMLNLWYIWSFESRKTYTWSSPKSSHSGFQVKSGRFQVKSTPNLIKSDVSAKTLQFGGCMEGAMTPDFMKSKVIAPLLHSSNWIVFVETSEFIRFWVDFTWNPPDLTWNLPDFMRISCEIERPLARNCNPYVSMLNIIHFMLSCHKKTQEYVFYDQKEPAKDPN